MLGAQTSICCWDAIPKPGTVVVLELFVQLENLRLGETSSTIRHSDIAGKKQCQIVEHVPSKVGCVHKEAQ